MSEEEIIDILENVYIFKNTSDKFTDLDLNAIQGLLDLYNKQKEEIKELNSEFAINTEIHKRDMKIKELEEVNNCLHETNNDYISKDKIKDKIEEIEKWDKELGFNTLYTLTVLNELLED